MKKQLLLFLLTGLFLSTVSNAQIKKGAIFLGGDIGGSNQKTEYNNGAFPERQTGLLISPLFGKAIKENLVFGGNLTVNLSNNKTIATNTQAKQQSYGGGFFLRKYKSVGKSGFYLFMQGGVNYIYYHSKADSNGPLTLNTNTVSVNIYPGISYSVSKKLQLETGLNNLLSLNYYTEKNIYGSGSPTIAKVKGFNIAGSIDNPASLYLGFRVLLN